MVPCNFLKDNTFINVSNTELNQKVKPMKKSRGLEKVKQNPEPASSFRLLWDVGWVSTNKIDSVRAASPEFLSIFTLGSRSQAAWAACSWCLGGFSKEFGVLSFQSFVSSSEIGRMTNTNFVISAIDDYIYHPVWMIKYYPEWRDVAFIPLGRNTPVTLKNE